MGKMDELKIVKSSERYAVSYCATFDAVAQENKFLSVSSGYSLSDMLGFIKVCRECGYPQYLLVDERDEAVGWCDIVRRPNHPDDVGYLGVAIRGAYRGRGWGSRLMQRTLAAAEKRGFREIRLEVRASNENAIRTYQRLGFVHIAHIKDGVVTDGVAEDVWVMSLGLRELPATGFQRQKFFGSFAHPTYRFVRPKMEVKGT